jgi:pyruvate dehydrogenase E1 component alpha subunit
MSTSQREGRNGGPGIIPLPYDPPQLSDILGPDWKASLGDLYRAMLFGRILDTRMLALQRQGRIGFYGPAMGQEACNAGLARALRPEDAVFPGLREQLVALLRGHPLETYLDHLFGNEGDPAKGRQMPNHPTARDVNYVSMSSVIGTQIVQAVGWAYGLKRRQGPGISVACFGDGATSANDFHSGLNFAAVLRVPVLFVCTNNRWAISVPVDRQTAVANLSLKGQAYGVPAETVDGTDVVAVFEALSRRREEVRTSSFPALLELVFDRLTPHSSSDDPTRYQPPGWRERALARDPLARLEELLDRLGVLSASEREGLRNEIEERVRRAVSASEVKPPPGWETLFQDTLSEPSWPLSEERDDFDKEQGGRFP